MTRSPLKGYYRYIARKYEPEFAKYGYSLIKGFVESEEALGSDSKVSAVLGSIYCLGADLGALCRRSAVRTKGYVKRGVKSLLPEFVLNRIRQTRQSALLSKPRIEVSWQITGIRKDTYVTLHPLIVEESKTGDERGRLINTGDGIGNR